jgi:transcriptional regulator with XRE-family HTH domain
VAIFLVVMRLKKAQEVNQAKPVNPLSKYPKWRDAEYRRAYLLASIEQGIAWQIKTNRTARGLSQADLADALGVEQSAVSQLEDPACGGYTVDTLLKLAEAFDCALSLRFVPFSELACESQDLSPQALYAAPYSEEILTS